MVGGQAQRRDNASRAHVGLDVDSVVTAAIEVLDDTGVDGFTIRALADRLRVSAPTIYWHVGSKPKLLELVADRVVTDLADRATSDGPWDLRLRHFLAVARACLLEHVAVPALLRTVHTHAFEQWIVAAFDIMSAAGFDDHHAAVYARLAMSHALSTAQSEIAATATPYLEHVPGTTNRGFRIRASELRSGLPEGVLAMTSFDLDEQNRLHDEVFVAGVSAASRERGPDDAHVQLSSKPL